MSYDQTKTKEHILGVRWLLGIVKFKTMQVSISESNELSNDWLN